MSVTARYEFASDNTAAICPEAWDAVLAANRDSAASYGDDGWTRRVAERVRQIFETDCATFLVFNGTAANSLALAQLCRPFDGVLCHERAHIETDECGAPEFFSGGAKLLRVAGRNGKLDLADAAAVIARYRDVHSSKPRVLSVTQATEFGTVYTAAELDAVAAFAREHQLLLHMDGARFANAIASLGCRPREITWERGVDVLAFGGTKNGAGAGELVVFFRPELAHDFDYRIKQAGQLASKSRFLAAPWLGLLADDAWLRNARRANESARRLEEELRALGALEIVFPRQANAVFLRLSDAVVRQLRALGWQFGNFFDPDIYRLMCSWATTPRQIEEFVADLRSAL